MGTILFLAVAVVLVFLGRVGFIVYETLLMDFDFNRPWHEDETTSEQLPEPKETIVDKAHPTVIKLQKLSTASLH